MIEPDIRQTLDELIRQKGEDYSSLSKMLGRNAAYIQQFIKRGVPRTLDEVDRRTLARYFGVAEASLGGPAIDAAADEAVPVANRRSPSGSSSVLVEVPRLGVGAAAGHGALNPDERPVGRIGFHPNWLRDLAPTSIASLSLIRVDGTSMLPTLSPGDDILVDLGDGPDRLRDGIYVLRIGDELIVKRLALFPQGRRFTIKSDNDQFPAWTDCTIDEVTVVGRVLWAGRRL